MVIFKIQIALKMFQIKSCAFLFTVLIIAGSCHARIESSKDIVEQPKVVQKDYRIHDGEQFILGDILDTAGKPSSLDFSKSDLTIIDFWNSDCPPCIEEMRKFSTMIVGKEQRIGVVSISLDYYPEFKKTFDKMPFMKSNRLPNWKLYSLKTNDHSESGRGLAMDRLEELQKKYWVSSFPSYLVVNREGIIQARPESAVTYISLLQL